MSLRSLTVNEPNCSCLTSVQAEPRCRILEHKAEARSGVYQDLDLVAFDVTVDHGAIIRVADVQLRHLHNLAGAQSNPARHHGNRAGADQQCKFTSQVTSPLARNHRSLRSHNCASAPSPHDSSPRCAVPLPAPIQSGTGSPKCACRRTCSRDTIISCQTGSPAEPFLARLRRHPASSIICRGRSDLDHRSRRSRLHRGWMRSRTGAAEQHQHSRCSQNSAQAHATHLPLRALRRRHKSLGPRDSRASR